MISARSKNLPMPVMRRLPKYLANLQKVKETNRRWVQSIELALLTGATSHTVRRDFSYLDSCSGVSSRGYEVEVLEKALVSVLGLDVPTRTVIVGAGQLGRALALDKGLTGQGFIICGVFDFDPRLHGKGLSRLMEQSTEQLATVVRDEAVGIGMIAAPAAVAQQAADQLVAAGVRGILNFSPVHVNVPETVAIVEMCTIAGLQQLSCAMKLRAESYATGGL